MRQHKVLMLVVVLILLLNIFIPVNSYACTYRGDLKITKTVDSKDFHDVEFKIHAQKLTRDGWVELSGSPFMLMHGGEKTFTGLDGDYTYRVIEEVPDCFEASYKVSGGQKNTEFRLLEPSRCCNQTTIVDILNTPLKFDLEIIKEVYIDGKLDPRNQEVFEFEVNGMIVTASAINPGHIKLQCGDYVVTEILKEGFVPDDNPQRVRIDGKDESIKFINRYETPKGWIKVCKDVVNVDGDSTLFNFGMSGEVSTSGAVSELRCVLIEDLPYGTYDFAERVPPGYKGIVTTDSVTINEKTPTGTAMFVNEKLLGSITVCKEVCGEDVDPTLFKFFMKGEVSTESAVSEEKCVTFENLPFGRYYLEESVPEGYTGSVTSGWVVIDENNPKGMFTFVNCRECPDMGTITIFKDVENVVNDETKFQFVMTGYDPLVVPVAAEVAKANGSLFFTSEMMPYVFNDMPYGTYYFEEINIPEDYEGVVTKGSVTISEEFPEGKVVFENMLKTGTVTICKDVTNVVDDETMFEFEIRGMDMTTTGSVCELKCVEIELPYGKYEIEEIVPDMYIGITTSGSFEINGETPNVKFLFENEERRGSIWVCKDVINVPDDETMFEFEVWHKDMLVTTGSVMEGEGNCVEIGDLEFGTYYLQEIVPDGYMGQVTTGMAMIDLKNPEDGIVFENIKECPLGSITIYKDVRNVEDDETEFPFVMTGIGEPVEILPLVKTAEVEPFVVSEMVPYMIEGISFGTYSFEEIVPEGYEGIVTTGSVVINEENRHGELTFVNDKEMIYGNVYVEKAFSEGSATTDMAFEYKIATDSAIDEFSDSVVSSSVVFGTPDGPYELPVGTYYLGERPYDGWEFVPDQEFTLMEGETKHLTLTNTAIEEPKCHMTIEKTVDDDYVKRDEEVTYTIVLHNDGDIDIWFDFWDCDDEEIDYEEYCIFLEAGATTERAFTTSYGSTGEYENVATATYCCEYCNGYPIDYIEVETDYDEMCMTISDSAIVEVYKESRDNDTYRMKITKEADADEYEVGDMITYTITVENTGNQTLTDIEVTDPMLDFEAIIERLPSSGDDTVEFEVMYETTEEGIIENTAYAKDDRARDVEDDESVIVNGEPPRDVPDPGLSIAKTIVGEKMENFIPGETVYFQLVVTNTGETDLENIMVVDAMAGYEYTIPALVEGASVTLDVSMVIGIGQDDFDNIATAETGDLFAQDFAPVTIAELIVDEEATPLELPAAGGSPTFLFYGLAALASGIGAIIKKRR